MRAIYLITFLILFIAADIKFPKHHYAIRLAAAACVVVWFRRFDHRSL
jgi:hypothetical protein